MIIDKISGFLFCVCSFVFICQFVFPKNKQKIKSPPCIRLWRALKCVRVCVFACMRAAHQKTRPILRDIRQPCTYIVLPVPVALSDSLALEGGGHAALLLTCLTCVELVTCLGDSRAGGGGGGVACACLCLYVCSCVRSNVNRCGRFFVSGEDKSDKKNTKGRKYLRLC